MNMKMHAVIELRRNYSWFALMACLSYTGMQTAMSDELLIPEGQADAPSFNLIATASLDAIPADNPIGAVLLTKHHPLLRRSDFSRVSEFVTQVYQKAAFQPIWFTPNRSEKNLNDLLSILNNAHSDALNPVNYDAEGLKKLIDTQNPDGNTVAGYDVALTVSLVRYLHDLRQGQVDPGDIQNPVHIAPKPPLDVAGLLNQHLSTQTLNDMVGLFEPKTRQYQQLKKILVGLQALDGHAGHSEFKPNKTLRPGNAHPHIQNLRHRLQAMGMLEDVRSADSQIYDEELVSAVKEIQKKQGLKADGIIGPATVKLFNLNPDEKISQLELAMERARWIPDVAEDGPMIVVNIPAFELWAFNSAGDQAPINMKVIVGKSPDNQTPVLWEEMKYLEFMPYWNIPKSIFEKEIRPKAASNASYLASHDIELIRHQNSPERGGGSYIRARQRPGKKNPLGRVKFVFPNVADVYLHDTPGRTAFNRPRRDLSHGCVRVSEPERLAEFVLGSQQGWDKESIKKAMSASKTRHVTLKRAVPVLFYYATTFVDHDNQLHFYPDVYGRDEQLKKALSKIQASNMLVSSSDVTRGENAAGQVAANP